MSRVLRDRIKRLSVALYLLGDRFGVHILPKHYYTPTADITWLKAHPDLWMPPAKMLGVDWNLPAQLEWLGALCGPYYEEVEGLEDYRRLEARVAGAGFEAIDSQVLHCFVRSTQPARIVEIGSGTSTLCMLNAVSGNQAEGRRASEITCVEPFPRPALRGQPGIRLIDAPVQAVDPQVFESLEAGDLLFVDSSHAVKAGSDLMRIYFEIVPNLADGVYVHIHDISLPYLYPRDVLESYLGWQESSLVLALLTGNSRLRVLASLSGLHYGSPGELRSILSDYVPEGHEEGVVTDRGAGHFPSSLYLISGPKGRSV